MNIFAREIKANWKALLFWSLGVLVLVVGALSKYDGFARAGTEAINEFMAVMPQQLMALFGGIGADLTNILTFYTVIFLYLPVLTAIHATLLGTGIISKEEQDKTTEFLNVKPTSRSRIITAKLAASLVLITALNLVIFLFSVLATEYYKKGDSIIGEIFLMMIGLYFVQLIFLSMGMAAAAIVRNPKLSAPIVSAVVMATFLLSIIIDLSGNLDNLKCLTPFKYFDAKLIAFKMEFELPYIVISLILTATFFSATYYFYNKRDLEV